MAKELFYSYSHKDEELRDELDQHLSLLQRNGHIIGWHDRRIGAGDEWRDEIDSHVRSADIILLLISASFLASEYCYGIELKIALERHARREAIVIPIILRPADWSDAPFAHLQALPKDARALTLWPNRDEAFAGIAKAIREVVARLDAAPVPPGGVVTVSDAYQPKPRVLDAAIPTHVVKGRSTELLVLIRLPESAGLSGILLADDEADAKPEDVRSRPFSVSFPVGHDGAPEPLKVNVSVTSPDFLPAEQTKKIYVPVDADSDVCPFMLTPIRLGSLKVLIELQWEDALRGHRRLLTECLAEAASVATSVGMNVVRWPVEVSPPIEQEPERHRVAAGNGSTLPRGNGGSFPPGNGGAGHSVASHSSYGGDEGASLARSYESPPPSAAPEPATTALPRLEQQRPRTVASTWRTPPPIPHAPASSGSSSAGSGAKPHHPPRARSGGSGGLLIACLAGVLVIFGAVSTLRFSHKTSSVELSSRLPEAPRVVHTFDGRVIDALSGRPLAAAKVSLTINENRDGSAQTLDATPNDEGRFSIDTSKLTPGAKATIVLTAHGYQPLKDSLTLSNQPQVARVYRLQPSREQKTTKER